jgi:hypothetical protein
VLCRGDGLASNRISPAFCGRSGRGSRLEAGT